LAQAPDSIWRRNEPAFLYLPVAEGEDLQQRHGFLGLLTGGDVVDD